MILKYRNRNKRWKPHESWHMLDNIGSINYTLCEKKELEKNFKKLGSIEDIDSCYLPKWFNYHVELDSMFDVYITFRDGKGEHINIDDDLFILNDEGKTIEVAYCVNLGTKE